MATLSIEPSSDGKLWVTLPYSAEGIERIKRIPGHRWNPERKQWLLPDTPQTRAALAEIVALRPKPRPPLIAVAPRREDPARKSRSRYVPGKSQPLTTDGTSTRRRFAPRQ